MVSISDFDYDDVASNPTVVTKLLSGTMVGYPVWIGEGAGSNPVSYT